jgi:hypothetical protein
MPHAQLKNKSQTEQQATPEMHGYGDEFTVTNFVRLVVIFLDVAA